MFEDFTNSNQQGNVGMCYAMAYYSKLGWNISVPITDSQDYDLIVDTKQTLLKVQVKTTKAFRDNCYQVGLRTSSGNKNVTTVKDFSENTSDILFVLTEKGDCYSIPKSEITAKTQLTLGERYLPFKVSLF